MASKKTASQRADQIPNEKLPELGQKMLWADDPQQVAKLIRYLAILCVALFVLDFIIHRHAYFALEKWYGFYAFAGFASFALIVLAAKQFRRLILRPEDYYAPRSVDAEEYPDHGLQPLTHGQEPTATEPDSSDSKGSRA